MGQMIAVISPYSRLKLDNEMRYFMTLRVGRERLVDDRFFKQFGSFVAVFVAEQPLADRAAEQRTGDRIIELHA